MGHSILWWEIPRRRAPLGETACALPGGLAAPQIQVDCVREELLRVGKVLGELAGQPLDDAAGGRDSRGQSSPPAAEVFAPARLWLAGRAAGCVGDAGRRNARHSFLLRPGGNHRGADGPAGRSARRVRRDQFIIGRGRAVFWVNPVADLRAMNLLEELGGRICGSDFMFSHALDLIPENLPPLEALARTALADPMVGPTEDRARRIVAAGRAAPRQWWSPAFPAQATARGKERLSASWCGGNRPSRTELEIPPVCDAMRPTLGSRLQGLLEIARAGRTK